MGTFLALAFWKVFFGSSVSGSYFWVVQKYSTSLIPVCNYAFSPPLGPLLTTKINQMGRPILAFQTPE